MDVPKSVQAASSHRCDESTPLFTRQTSLVCRTETGEDSAGQCLCRLSQECDKCAVRVLQLYLFAVWWVHDSRPVYEFLLEPDGCKATKRMPATHKCQMFKPLHVNIHGVCSQQCCRAQSQRQAAGFVEPKKCRIQENSDSSRDTW